jgi:probable addiction module antidote protein
MSKRNYKTLDQVEAEYLRNHPEEVDSYMETLFSEFGETGDAAALLSSLRVVAKVKGMSKLAEQVGLTRGGFYKALSSKGNPRFENLNAIMHAFGYQLMPQKIETHAS